MNYLEKIQQFLPDWSPSTIFQIVSASIENGDLEVLFNCQPRNANPWPNDKIKFTALKLRFEGVESLKINFESPYFQHVSGLDILDISPSGWENLMFRVWDHEGDAISFYCKSIEMIEP